MSIPQCIVTSEGSIPVQELCGWADRPDLLEEAFILWNANNSFDPYPLQSLPYRAGSRVMMWELGRKILGADTPNYRQLIGDCVSHGAKNACEYMQFFPIVSGERIKWTPIFPPYLYGCGRVLIGKGQLGNEDGSLGIWQAQAVMQYGVIAANTPNCPAYSGEVAKTWGRRPGPPNNFITLGKEHLVQKAAKVKVWEELVAAITNYYPVTIASNVGFDMTPRSDGFHHNSTTWAHQMCIIGVDDDASEPHACILNSWGESAHGVIKDFKTGENWPGGTLRVRKKDIEKILAQDDSFAYSSLQGFPEQNLPDGLFDLW